MLMPECLNFRYSAGSCRPVRYTGSSRRSIKRCKRTDIVAMELLILPSSHIPKAAIADGVLPMFVLTSRERDQAALAASLREHTMYLSAHPSP
jgi:hypothetical protein